MGRYSIVDQVASRTGPVFVLVSEANVSVVYMYTALSSLPARTKSPGSEVATQMARPAHTCA